MSGRSALALVVVMALALAGVWTHAGLLRARSERGLAVCAAIVTATGSADLALSSGARWLRHPTSAEPAAGCAGPTCLDTDPAGLALPPPREIFSAEGERRIWRLEAP